MMKFAALAVFLCAAAAVARAGEAPPRFVSLRADQGFLREGPSYAHPVLWTYHHKGYPFELLSVYDVWRRVRDADGTIGWMSSSVLSNRRTVLVRGSGRSSLRAGAAIGAKIVGWAQPGVVAALKSCELRACQITSGGLDGWIDKNKIWGVSAGEVFR